MPTTVRESSISFTGIEANQIFFEPVFKDIIDLGFFRIMPNVVNKKKMAFVGQMEKIVQKKTGCGFKPFGNVAIYDRTIEVDEIKVNVEICNDEFKDTVWQEKLQKGNLQFDLGPTEIGSILIQKIQDATMLDYIRLFWFGDKSSNDPLYNITDGMWTVHIPDLVGQNLIPYTNTGSGAALAPGDGENYLREVYDNAPLALKGLPNSEKVFLVSGSIFEQYRDDLENSGGGDAGRQMLIDGQMELTFRGIRVIPNWNWDKYTSADLNLPDYHQILYTTPNNLVFATDLASSLNSIQVFTDDLEEKTYMKVNGKMGTNFVHPSLMSVGY